jgi:diaminopimelate decarboxylase
MYTYNQLLEIASHVGNSFYDFNRAQLIDNYERFIESFRKYYDNTFVAYAFKANYALFVVEIIRDLGGLSEVVSTMEYDIAFKCKIAPEKIIFNGPLKSKEDIKKAILNQTMLNLDSFYELEYINILNQEDEEFEKFQKKIGLRLNLTLPGKPASRFGFTKAQLKTVIQKIKNIKNLEIAGIHCHFTTSDKNPKNYRLIAEKMIGIAEEELTDFAIEYINLGGGYFGKIPEQLRKNFPGPIFKTAEYATAIAGTFQSAFGGKGPNLIIEPGVSLVGDTMSYYTRILELKEIQSKTFALTHGSMLHIKPTGGNLFQPFEVIKAKTNDSNTKFLYDISGNTCMEHDILYKDYKGNLEVGDFLLFHNKGAYTNVYKPPFIHYSPAIIECNNGKIKILKRTETVDDILETYMHRDEN